MHEAVPDESLPVGNERFEDILLCEAELRVKRLAHRDAVLLRQLIGAVTLLIEA